MKTYKPSFYDSFVCLAGNCPDSCCTEWKIPVDENTAEFFRSKKGDEFAATVVNSIVTDADGDEIFELKNGRCPFLNGENLCDIRIRYGQEHTCDVCRMYPDFVEEYGDFTEICPSLSCPGVTSLILSGEASYPVHATADCDEWLQLLLGLRNAFLTHKAQDFSSFAKECVNRVYRAENAFAACGDDSIDFEINGEEFDFFRDEALNYYDEITAFLLRLEILTPAWREILQKAYDADEDTVIGSFSQVPEEGIYVFRYLLFRYFLKAVNGYSASAIIRLLAFIVPVLFAYSRNSGLHFSELVRLASKEIEHNADNVTAFADYFL